MRDDYVITKEDARQTVTDIIKKKYASMTNCEYLERDFDFYGMTFRLQAHEKKKIAKNTVFSAMGNKIE